MVKLQQENTLIEQEILSKEQQLQSDQEDDSDEDLANALDEDFRQCEKAECPREPCTPVQRDSGSPELGEIELSPRLPSPARTI